MEENSTSKYAIVNDAPSDVILAEQLGKNETVLILMQLKYLGNSYR